MNQEPIQNHHVIVSKLNYSAELHGALVKRQEPLTKNKLSIDSLTFKQYKYKFERCFLEKKLER